MGTDVIKYSLWFVLAILMQALVFNNIGFAGYVNPYPYIFFLILMPASFKGVKALSVGFLFGFCLDLFSGTGGLHAAACTWLAMMRPLVFEVVSPRESFEKDMVPSASAYGLPWLITYVAVCVILHHFWLFFFEIFSFQEILSTLGRASFSAVFSVFLIVALHMATDSGNKRK